MRKQDCGKPLICSGGGGRPGPPWHSKSSKCKCSLYDPALDVAVETADGEAAGYALFWFDPVTKVGLVEPMRVEHAYQRRGLARAMLTAGLDRLANRGATRVKVGYSTTWRAGSTSAPASG